MFLLARAQKFFKTRSDARNIKSDQARLRLIAEAIESAIEVADAERIGLGRRIEDTLARAAVTFGTGTDEYLERDAIDSKFQDLLGAEIKNGRRSWRTDLICNNSQFLTFAR